MIHQHLCSICFKELLPNKPLVDMDGKLVHKKADASFHMRCYTSVPGQQSDMFIHEEEAAASANVEAFDEAGTLFSWTSTTT